VPILRIPLPRLATAGALVLAASTGACGSGGGGDLPTRPLASEYGSCSRLAQIVGPAVWQTPEDKASPTCAPPLERPVCVSGVSVVAIDRFDETGKGAVGNYYVEDTENDADYSGITVFAPAFSPPDLRLAEGDVVDMVGTQTEFLGPTSAGRFGFCRTLPELSGTLSFRFDGNYPPPPKVIPVTDLKTYATARKHLGKLVKIENVKLAGSGTNNSGRFTADLDVGGGIPVADVPRISNELFDVENEGPLLVEGGTFTSITGVVTYFYGFKLAPRAAADFEP
jgi:hypothetical protein